MSKVEAVHAVLAVGQEERDGAAHHTEDLTEPTPIRATQHPTLRHARVGTVGLNWESRSVQTEIRLRRSPGVNGRDRQQRQHEPEPTEEVSVRQDGLR